MLTGLLLLAQPGGQCDPSLIKPLRDVVLDALTTVPTADAAPAATAAVRADALLAVVSPQGDGDPLSSGLLSPAEAGLLREQLARISQEGRA